MKIADGQYDPMNAAFMEMMVKELSKQPKKPATTTQCASTQATLNRPKEQDEAHFNRVIEKYWEPTTELGRKDFDPTQVAIIEDLRRKSKNTLGASPYSSMTPESRERAIEAFTYTPPAALTPEQILKAKQTHVTQITEYQPTPEDLEQVIVETPKETWVSKMMGWGWRFLK